MVVLRRLFYVTFALALCCATLAQAQVARFVGNFSGSAEVPTHDGGMAQRDMSVAIRQEKEGFTVTWSSTTYRDGKGKQKTYKITFVPTDRNNVFAAAMTRNVFGHEVPLDPMKGEPYVWARIMGDTLTVYSLFVDETGGFELQQFDRRLVSEGLELTFTALSDTTKRRSVTTVLERQ